MMPRVQSFAYVSVRPIADGQRFPQQRTFIGHSLIAAPLSIRARPPMKSTNPDRADPRFRGSAYALGFSAERAAFCRRVNMNVSARDANGIPNEASGVIGRAAIG
jgi:hypothetical protein